MDLVKTLIKYMPDVEGAELVARRPATHPKGKKELMRIELGEPIPPGVILGKGTLITIEPKHEPTTTEV